MTSLASVIVSWNGYRARLAELRRIAWSTYGNQSAIANMISANLGHIDITELRKSDVDIFVAERLQTCAPVTVDAEMQVFRQLLNWTVDEKIIAERPRLPTVSVPNTEKPLPGDDDYGWYLRTMSGRHSDALMFALLTGLAPHELERIQTRDFDAAKIEIAIGGRDDFQVKQESRRRLIPLNPAALAIWQRCTLGTKPDRSPFPKSGAMQRAMRRHFLTYQHIDAPIAADGLTPKMMRKWFASKVANEQSEAVLQRLLGHAPGSKVTRKHYVRSTDAQLREAVAALR